MDIALRYLPSRARTVREVENYLDERQFDEVTVATEFVQSRLRTKPISRASLSRQLAEHFVDSNSK